MRDRFSIDDILEASGSALIGGVPEGYDAHVVAELVAALGGRNRNTQAALLHIARDDRRMAAFKSALEFFAPGMDVITIPAWDCVPYDRISPKPGIAAERISGLARIAALDSQAPGKPIVVLTSVNGAIQLVPKKTFFKQSVMNLSTGLAVAMEDVVVHLERSGFARNANVMEPGEYAVRGGLLDLFPPGVDEPVRLDFFGDRLETIRIFDPESQRTNATLKELALLPVSETPQGDDVRRRFRQKYVELFGAVTRSDPLYEAISSGARYQGEEHWLPLFHDGLVNLFDYLAPSVVSLDHMVEEARRRRLEQIQDHYESRATALEQKSFGAPPYKPPPPESLFMTEQSWQDVFETARIVTFTPFELPQSAHQTSMGSLGAKQGRSFAAERAQENVNVFDAAVSHIKALQAKKKRTILACWSKGARARLKGLLADHGLAGTKEIASFQDFSALPDGLTGLTVLGLESGFEALDFAVIAEQDILGDRLVRPRRRRKLDASVFAELSSISQGDLVVHADHGIGRFQGLETIVAAGAPHDCLELVYSGGDKLFLPVENIDLLSRYGSDESAAQLDRLGGVFWQTRKARLKDRLWDIAAKLIKVAAKRALRQAPRIASSDGLYEEFCARFPYEETDDQLASIDAVLADLDSGRPMDRLICGDVGFGKTEVALRSAFVSVMAGKQVAVVVPTTLLARQHFQTFNERFQGYPVRIAQASRLVSARDIAAVKQGLKTGEIDIVIGTHALLGNSIEMTNMGLLIIDEEQHFGVHHKERLKEMRADVHVLTLTATPIPRTLQLALSGVRELSLIATPPLDRLAVRTYVTPFDALVLKEALLRERFRGGQSFYVCPRISNLDEVGAFLAEHVPELKVGRAHGQMPSGQLEDVMNAFYDRGYDVLLCTSIVESGLDIPTANTLIVHCADQFGLAQLYQLRGRVGRAKTRAYAYFTLPLGARLTPAAEKRLNVLQSLDTLGAGFALASHDLDIRGAGNLLGEEQSGHIKEVGFELYQAMLEEAVSDLKEGEPLAEQGQWSPRISIGTAVLIPEIYVPDLSVRLGLYRRLSLLEEEQEIEAFAAELVDRFGTLPREVAHLLDVVQIKALCRQAGVEQVEAGPKGAQISFKNNSFSNLDGLISFITKGGEVKLLPDHKLIFKGDWAEADQRLKGTRALLRQLVEIAGSDKKAS